MVQLFWLSGRIYHVRYDPPKRPGVDDDTGDALVQRPDDEEATVRDRLRVYHEQTGPLAAFYRDLAARTDTRYGIVDGSGSVAAVRTAIAEKLLRQ